MKYAKLIIKPKTPFLSLLQSDTIFGNFAWIYRYIYGEKALTDKLPNNFIVFSDGFIKGFLPRPFFKPYFDDEINKEIKKISLLPKKLIFNLIDKFNKNEIDLNSTKPEATIVKYLKSLNKEKELKLPKKETLIIQKNAINRLTNLTNGRLYTLKEEYSEAEYEIYFYTSLQKDEVKEVIETMSKRGYGKDKTAGKGRFSYKIEWDFEEKKYFTNKGNFFINLSTMLKDENSKLIYGKSITKFPKAGGIYAYSKPFKNPILAYIPGSVFKVNDDIVGKMEKVNSNIYQNGYAIGLRFGAEK
jgi:CRISPR-associated protein Csm4